MLSGNSINVSEYYKRDKTIEDDFNNGKCQVIVTTDVFDMGIDKDDVRFVLHYNMPRSMEKYYRDTNYAGKDGKASECILMFSKKDIVIAKNFLKRKEYRNVSKDYLEKFKQRDRERLNIIMGYCETSGCLRNYISGYFGEKKKMPCNNCGNCNREFFETDMTDEAKVVIKCIQATGEKLGFARIRDILLGRTSVILHESKINIHEIFGRLKNNGEWETTALIEQMVEDDHLKKTNDEYNTIKLGDVDPVLSGDARVIVRIRKDNETKDEKYKPFYITPVDSKKFEYKEYNYVTYIAEELNRISTGINERKVSCDDIIEFLMSSGYLEIKIIDGFNIKVMTPLGNEKGMITEIKTQKNGKKYSTVSCSLEIQKEIVNNFIQA